MTTQGAQHTKYASLIALDGNTSYESRFRHISIRQADSIELLIRAHLLYRALVSKTVGQFTDDNYKEACRVGTKINTPVVKAWIPN